MLVIGSVLIFFVFPIFFSSGLLLTFSIFSKKIEKNMLTKTNLGYTFNKYILQVNRHVLLCLERLFSFCKNILKFLFKKNLYINIIKINIFINFFKKNFFYKCFNFFLLNLILFLSDCSYTVFKFENFFLNFFIFKNFNSFWISLFIFHILIFMSSGVTHIFLKRKIETYFAFFYGFIRHRFFKNSFFVQNFVGFFFFWDYIFLKKKLFYFLKNLFFNVVKILLDFFFFVYIFRYFINHYIDRLIYHKSIFVSNWRTVKWRWRKRANAATFIRGMSRKGNLINTWRYWVLLNHHWYFIIRFFRFPRVKFWFLYRFSKKPLIFHYYDDGFIFYQLNKKLDDLYYLAKPYTFVWEINWFFFFGF